MENMNIFSKDEVQLQNPVRDSEKVVYDCVYFGSYPQSDVTGQKKDPIKWRVLSVDGNCAFLVADQNLDVQKYHGIEATWETSMIRNWLNGYVSDSNMGGKDYSSNNFISRAFTEEEQEAILITDVENADNSFYGTEGGNDTQDKVFLLSYNELTNPEYGFSSEYKDDNARVRTNTAYVAARGNIGSYMNGACNSDWWWLRSPSNFLIYTMCVMYNGYVDRDGRYVDDYGVAVCPALHLNLAFSSLWTYADKVKIKLNSKENWYCAMAAGSEEAGYTKVNNVKEPLILEEEDFTAEEFRVYKKLFSCPDNVTRIKVTLSQIEYM